jgi:hypothetical protein
MDGSSPYVLYVLVDAFYGLSLSVFGACAGSRLYFPLLSNVWLDDRYHSDPFFLRHLCISSSFT